MERRSIAKYSRRSRNVYSLEAPETRGERREGRLWVKEYGSKSVPEWLQKLGDRKKGGLSIHFD